MSATIRPSKRDPLRFNIMVVGESGLGKTTFLHALLRKYADNVSIASHDIALGENTIKIARVGNFQLATDNKDSVDINCYDSPGYGDFVNNQESIDNIKKYVLKCHQSWKSLVAQSMTEAEFLQADERIHCIFYFFGTHRVKNIDLEFISTLAPLVPIIPVIGKSDSMTLSEKTLYLDIVQQKLNSISEKLGDSCIYDFQGSDLTDNNNNADSIIHLANIFALVCDSTSQRVYPWGTIPIDNAQYSDFRLLQSIIFENDSHVKGLMDETRRKSIALFKPPSPIRKPAPAPATSLEVDVDPVTNENSSDDKTGITPTITEADSTPTATDRSVSPIPQTTNTASSSYDTKDPFMPVKGMKEGRPSLFGKLKNKLR